MYVNPGQPHMVPVQQQIYSGPGQQYQVIPQVRISLRVNEMLHRGERLTSHNGMYFAVLQDDGNFIVYSSHPLVALWATNTHHQGNAHVVV